MLTVGTTKRGKRVSLTDKERARHIHVLGAIGTGKSKLLEHMIRQDIARGRGLCLVDPHGTLVDNIESWCVSRGLGRVRHIHVVRPGDDTLVPGFNPLRNVPGEALSVRVDAMVGACGQAWGVQNMNETPRLEKILRALFFALAARNLTLAEGPDLLRAGDPEGVRRLLTEGLPDPVFQITWDELNGMSRKDFAEHVESTHTYSIQLPEQLAHVVDAKFDNLTFRLVAQNDPAIGKWQMWNDPARGTKYGQDDVQLVTNALSAAGQNDLGILAVEINRARGASFQQIQNQLAADGTLEISGSNSDVLISRKHNGSFYRKPVFFSDSTLSLLMQYCANINIPGFGPWRLASEADMLMALADGQFVDTPDHRLWGQMTAKNADSQSATFVTSTVSILGSPNYSLYDELPPPIGPMDYEDHVIVQDNAQRVSVGRLNVEAGNWNGGSPKAWVLSGHVLHFSPVRIICVSAGVH